MATPNLGFQNFYTTTLSSGITATDTTIYLNSLPTPTEGYLVIEPDSSTNKEIIYYTSKGANFVTLPSIAAGRGVGATTAVSHNSGVTCQMNVVAEHFEALQDGTSIAASAITSTKIANYSDIMSNFVVSGGIWSGDAYASTRAASMTAAVCYIDGIRTTVSLVTARTFTASKDTYVDILSNGAGTGTIVYTEVTNDAASPALAATSIRLAIITTGASNIASVNAIHQGNVNLAGICSAAMVCNTTIKMRVGNSDSLGNLIRPNSHRPNVIAGITRVLNSTTGNPGATHVVWNGCNGVPFIAEPFTSYIFHVLEPVLSGYGSTDSITFELYLATTTATATTRVAEIAFTIHTNQAGFNLSMPFSTGAYSGLTFANPWIRTGASFTGTMTINADSTRMANFYITKA